MTIEEAIKVLERVEDYVGIHYINGVEDPYINPYLLKAIDFAIAALREQEERKWISATERLPQNYISVLTFIPTVEPLPTVHEAYIGGDGEWHSTVFYGIEDEDVTHWMPLPEPPKEDNNV